MSLIEECLAKLNKDSIVLSEDEKKIIERKLFNNFPMTSWGRIDWSSIEQKKEVKSLEELRNMNLKEEVYVIWTDIELPILKLSTDTFFKNSIDILAVSFDTWLLFEDGRTVVEVYHENEITVGFK